MDPLLVAGLLTVGLVAFTVEGTIGFGGTVLAASLGAQFMALGALLPGFVPINVVMSSWIVASSWRKIAWRQLLTEVLPPVACGTAAGIVLTRVAPAAHLQLAFAIFVVGLSTLEVRRNFAAPSDGAPAAAPVLPMPLRLLLLAIGGVAHGLFATGGPMVVYVMRRRIPDKSTFRATLAVLWISLNAALLICHTRCRWASTPVERT